jgi:hypothetical protein
VRTPIAGAHLCFRAPSRAAVDAFHAAALAAGGRDHGLPGLRPHYHADYYGAFVLDPDGHRLEAVCHAPAIPIKLADGSAMLGEIQTVTDKSPGQIRSGTWRRFWRQMAPTSAAVPETSTRATRASRAIG